MAMASLTLNTLVSFNVTNGSQPSGSLIADDHGNLFGTTSSGGAHNLGTVFEIPREGSHLGSPITLVSFSGTDGSQPSSSLILDDHGNLFGTTFLGGASSGINGLGFGTVFEITHTASGYASTPTTLVSFNGADGANPVGSLIMDANGNLFGATLSGGPNFGQGTVFEIAKTASGFANAPTTLVTFHGADGEFPVGGLIFDASGDLFGMTTDGGAFGEGTVFGIQKTGSGFASTPTLPWSPSMAPTERIRRAACSSTPMATCSARPF